MTENPSADGVQVLAAVEEFIGRYVKMPNEHCIPLLVLWAVHTWCVSAFYVTPRLVLDSPEPGSGKTRVLEVLALLCRSAKLTLSTTTAALYRRIAAAGDDPPTILQDEADAVFGRTNNPQSEDLRALFNAGYKRGATVDRCEGDAKNMKVREFPVFAPVALAGLAGKMPATITTRSVTMHMRRRAPGEHVGEYRERDAGAYAEPLRMALEEWAVEHLDELARARPKMPDGVRDRPAEVWEALLAIADTVGGDWPERARAACRHFVLDVEPDELSFGARLLRDIRTEFGDREAMFSADIVAGLTAGDESEWADLWGKPLDQRRLAKELKRYGVTSAMVRIGARQARGYRVADDTGLGQAWDRYLPNSIPKRTERTERINAGQSGTDGTHDTYPRTERTASVPSRNGPDLQEHPAGTDGTAGTHTDGSRAAQCRSCGGRMLLDADIAEGVHGGCAAPRLHVVHPQTAVQWMAEHVRTLISNGDTEAESSAVYAAGRAAGFSIDSLRQAARKSDLIAPTAARAGATIWKLGAGGTNEIVSAPQWLAGWLKGRGWVRAADVFAAGADAGHGRQSVKSAGLAEHILKRGSSVATEWSLDPNYHLEEAS